MRTALIQQRGRLEQLESGLRALSPVAILERGYALVFNNQGQLVKDSEQVETGDQITARLVRGSLTARVEKKN